MKCPRCQGCIHSEMIDGELERRCINCGHYINLELRAPVPADLRQSGPYLPNITEVKR